MMGSAYSSGLAPARPLLALLASPLAPPAQPALRSRSYLQMGADDDDDNSGGVLATLGASFEGALASLGSNEKYNAVLISLLGGGGGGAL